MGHEMTQRDRVELQKQIDAAAIAQWEEVYVAYEGDVTRIAIEEGITIPRVPFVDLPNPAAAWHMFGAMGADFRPHVVVQVRPDPEGEPEVWRPFRMRARQTHEKDDQLITAGHTDPSGGFWMRFNAQRSGSGGLKFYPCLNAMEGGTGWVVSQVGYDRLRYFDLDKGALTNDPRYEMTDWGYAWFRYGHPGYRWRGFSRIDPFPVPAKPSFNGAVDLPPESY